MNLLDWMLVLLVVAYALSGYWQGFVTGAFATVGLLLGGLFGIWLAPQALGDAQPSLWVSLGALFIVILSATIGQAMFQYAGAKVRDKITWQPARAVDAVGGAALSALAVLLVAWALGVAVSGSRIGPITPQVRNSTVLAKVNEALPTSAGQALQAFNTVVGTSFFPRYLEPFARERIAAVSPPPPRIVRDPDVVDAGASVLKIHGDNSCGRGVEGTSDDFASMNEVLSRRLARYLDESEKSPHDAELDASFAALPGLIMIDGGKGQLAAGVRALQPLIERGTTVISLAKRLEEVYVPGRSAPLPIRADSEASRLLQRVRDEAHRFALDLHRKRRGKAMTGSVLDGLRGVGPARKRALLSHFGSPERFLDASAEEIEAVPGIPGKLARDIHRQLNKAG